MKNQTRSIEKSNDLDTIEKTWYAIGMNQKFIAVPRQIYVDVRQRKLIPTDIMVYIYLCAKCAHGKPVYLCRKTMCADLGEISLSKLSDSLRRLGDNGHLCRKKLNGVTSTALLTFVKDRGNIYIKGQLQNENIS